MLPFIKSLFPSNQESEKIQAVSPLLVWSYISSMGGRRMHLHDGLHSVI